MAFFFAENDEAERDRRKEGGKGKESEEGFS